MDGVGEDFSGLPEHRSREERREERRDQKFTRHRSDPHRGRRTRILLVGGFAVALALIAVSLIVVFAPTPYLGTGHEALARSVGGSGQDCRPVGDGWTCTKEAGGTVARYEVKVDWAGCWSGTLIGPPAAREAAQPKISGCVSLLDQFTAG